MRWHIFFYIIIIVISISEISSAPTGKTVTGDAITGEIITGKATTQGVGLNISVTNTTTAGLTIFSPKNKTYFANNSLLLNFISSNAQAIWYNLDNIQNRTITGETYFNVSIGNHTLYLFANNSNGDLTRKNVSFSVNLTMLSINLSNFQNFGATTNFNQFSFEESQNLTNITFEGQRGKIFFLSGINLTYSGSIDLDRFINITSNRIEINSTALPNFNTSAKLSLYNLTFSDPRISMDGIVCPDSICTKESYTNGVLTFNVTHFTAFEAEETPSGSSSSGGDSGSISSGGGSGGSSSSSGKIIASVKEFSINEEEIKISLKQGQTKSTSLTIRNTGTQKLSLTLMPEKIDELIKISETSFEIAPGESKVVTIDVIARRSTIPNLYMGKIKVKGNTEKEILVAIEIESEKALFDVNIDIPQRFKFIDPGEELIANIKLFNLGVIGRVDIKVDYEIKDSEGRSILMESETIAIETQSSLSKIFKISENTPTGDYVLYVKTTTPEGEVASATEWFSIGKIPISKHNLYIYLIIFILIIILVIIFYEIRKIKKEISLHHKINEKDLMKGGYIKK